MDHNAVVREKMTEKYLLNELDPQLRDAFEEHFFDCPECALDVRAGTEFVAQSKAILAEPEPIPARVPTPEPAPARREWFSWLRPAFAAPALAVLLAVIGYQNLVTYPRLKQPHVLAWTAVNVGTWGAGGPMITVPQGQAFLLFVRIPPDGAYTRYTADLYNPAGKLESSLAFPAISGQDEWPVEVPGATREPGTYTLTVRGITPAGESKDLGKTSFELQIPK
jgi:hypothetical protein